MKATGAVLGALAATIAVGLVLAASRSKPSDADKPPSAALRPPMSRGLVYMVTYSMPATMSQAEARGLLNFSRTPVQFAPDIKGKPTVVITAEALEDLPNGPPQIPSSHGALVPYVWLELPDGGIS